MFAFGLFSYSRVTTAKLILHKKCDICFMPDTFPDATWT